MIRHTLLLSLLCLGLTACGEQNSDLKQWVKETDNLPRDRIPPLPDVKPYEAFTYDAYSLIDPFRPRKIEPPKSAAGSGIQPDLTRRKEPLEAYPLENLRMVGTLQQNKANFALVKSPDNNLFRVKTGNYMGQNFGLITGVNENEIKLRELIQDATGDWTERVSTLQLQEATK
jgi:type IV pilus assembly protein PilP